VYPHRAGLAGELLKDGLRTTLKACEMKRLK
jgi:hypothetical protein